MSKTMQGRGYRDGPAGGRSARGRLALCGALACVMLLAGGCNIFAPIGGMMENARREGSTEIEAEYTGLDEKSFAVVVSADRAIQAEHPAVLARLTTEISERIAKNTKAAKYVPGTRVLNFQFENPRWSTWTPSELAKKLGVERIVFVDVDEYRLKDPGNRYIWKGVAAASVRVSEADGRMGDDFAFRKTMQVTFPDKDGFTPQDMPEELVNTALSNRVIDRVSWLFYKHEEKNIITY